MERVYSGFIDNYNATSNYQITGGMVPQYYPAQTDYVVATACPKDTSGTSDNINVYVEWDHSNSVWSMRTSDTAYSGDIAFIVVVK